jgi:hypothetical protein
MPRNFTCPLTEASCDRDECRRDFCALQREEASQHKRRIARQQETAPQREHQLRLEQAVALRNREAIALILVGGFTRREIFEITRRRGYRSGWAWHLINQLEAEGKLAPPWFRQR